MTAIAEEAVSTQTPGRVTATPRACPVCDGTLHALGARRWGCEKGHTVTSWPELMEAAGRFRLGWAEDAPEGSELSPAARARQKTESQPERPNLPLPTGEDIAASKAAWERKLKRERQRRWRARARAGLV